MYLLNYLIVRNSRTFCEQCDI